MSEAVTSYDSTTGGVKISWTSPSSNYDTITAYNIEILDKANSAWSTETANCDGSNSIILANLYCIIPMTTLYASPFNLEYNDLVEVRISAYNQFGWSAESDTNTVGATILTEPQQMSIPRRGSSTTISQVQVEWDSLTTDAEKGGSPILSYHL